VEILRVRQEPTYWTQRILDFGRQSVSPFIDVKESKASIGPETILRVPLAALSPDPANARKDRLPIDVLAADPKNPRQMSARARDGLCVSLETFGPLDIVFNETTKQLVSGHQRIAALKAAGATELVRDGQWFYVEHPKTKERFPVRIVAWDETRQRMANLVANNPKISGEFTEDVLAQLKELEGEAGFELLALDELEKELEAVPAEMETARKRASLEDFDLSPPPKKAWIMIATSSDLLPEIAAAIRKFEGDDTRVEVSGG
jgi:ParB-like chromosome segregation protein Spo0J